MENVAMPLWKETNETNKKTPNIEKTKRKEVLKTELLPFSAPGLAIPKALHRPVTAGLSYGYGSKPKTKRLLGPWLLTKSKSVLGTFCILLWCFVAFWCSCCMAFSVSLQTQIWCRIFRSHEAARTCLCMAKSTCFRATCRCIKTSGQTAQPNGGIQTSRHIVSVLLCSAWTSINKWMLSTNCGFCKFCNGNISLLGSSQVFSSFEAVWNDPKLYTRKTQNTIATTVYILFEIGNSAEKQIFLLGTTTSKQKSSPGTSRDLIRTSFWDLNMSQKPSETHLKTQA